MKTRRCLGLLLLIAAAGAFADRAALNQTAPAGEVARSIDPADWPMYNHDAAGWRFNRVEDVLSPSNVGQIVEKWQFPARDSQQTIGVVHATPSVVGGVMKRRLELLRSRLK